MRLTSIVIFILFSSTVLYAQDKFLYASNDTTETIFLDSLKSTKNVDNNSIKRTFYKSGQIKAENYFVSNLDRKFHGKQTNWFKNGTLKSEIHFSYGKKGGSSTHYWENGTKKRNDTYKNGILLNGDCWDIDGNKIDYYNFVIQPKFPGGSKGLAAYLSQSIKYPRNSRTSSIRGKVIVSFKIQEDGQVADVQIIKGVNLVLNNEAKRVVQNMPKWAPGLRNGTPVASELSIPIVFLRN